MAAITHRLRCEILESRRLATSDVLDSLAVSVESFDIEGLRAAEIRVKYDPRSLDLSDGDIQPGEAWQGRASLISHIDEEAGAVSIFLFSAEPIDSQHGKLVDLQFAAIDSAIAEVSSTTLTEVRLNEGTIESNGQITTTDAALAEPAPQGRACMPWPN